MRYSVLGLNYRTAPPEIRGAFALLPHLRKEIYKKTSPRLDGEFLYLSTCNRTELYYAGKNKYGFDDLLTLLFSIFDTVVSRDFFYFFQDREAVKHLFEVITGLDSMVVGEKEIVAQVKEAYQIAHNYKTAGKYLEKLFSTALHVNKDVRTAFPELSSPISIPYIAVKILKEKIGSLLENKFLIIGSGSMADLVAKNFVDYGVKKLTFTSKHIDRAREIARNWGAEAIGRDFALEHLSDFDGIVIATTVSSPIITEESFASSPGSPIVIIDISIPRGAKFSKPIKNIEVIYLDDLKGLTEENKRQRLKAVKKVADVLEEESFRYMRWVAEQYVAPMIEKMYSRSEEIRKEMMEELYSRYKIPREMKEKIDYQTSLLVRKLIHLHLEKVRDVTRGAWSDEIYDLIQLIFSGYERKAIDTGDQGKQTGPGSDKKG